MNLDYKNLTEDQLEEFVEFVDWSMVPTHLITKEIVNKFSCFNGLLARMWFEDVISKLNIKEDKKRFPNTIFFFLNGESKKGYLWCSLEKIWSIFNKKYKFFYPGTQNFIKNTMESYLKNKEVIPTYEPWSDELLVEEHFKLKEITPKKGPQSLFTITEAYFNNK